jgi:carboxymethylenebutenolidase
MKKIFVILLSAIVFMSCNSKKDDPEPDKKKAAEEIIFKKSLEKEIKYLSGKDSVGAYFSLPAGEGPFPAIILIHEKWGLNDWIRNNTEVLKNKGYIALAIDLYRGKATNNLDSANEQMQSLPPDRAMQDIKSGYTFLESNPKVDKNKIGIIGWGMGGGYALQAATYLPKLKAASVNYGTLISDPVIIKKISCPVLGIFGETDRGLPVMDVQNFEKSLKDAKKESKIIIYRNVGHAFMNRNNKEGYNPDITERAWREIFAFLEKHLSKK